MKKISERLGESKYNNQGCLMKIVKYNSAANILVEFQDKYKFIVNTQYGAWERGEIKNPNFQNKPVSNRIGEKKYCNQGCEMEIVEYVNAKNIKVKFNDEKMAIVPTVYDRFLKGEVKNPYFKSLYSTGYIGYVYKNKEYVKTKSFIVWKSMLDRCYGDSYPTYADCIVCEDWHSFYNFNAWFIENYYEIDNIRMNLDKDILVKGNKTYSPNTCIFAPYDINTLFVKANAIRGNYPIGVSSEHGKYSSKCSNNGKGINLGRYDTVQEAFNAYKNYKENTIKQMAMKYKGLIPDELYEALCKYKVEITD